MLFKIYGVTFLFLVTGIILNAVWKHGPFSYISMHEHLVFHRLVWKHFLL